MTTPRLTPEQAQAVFARAADLDRGDPSGDATLAEADVVEVAKAAGLSEAAVRQAMAEWRSGQLHRRVSPDPDRFVVVERTVPGSVDRVHAAIARYAGSNQLQVVRHDGARTRWEPRDGLMAKLIAVADPFLGRAPLGDVSALVATVSPVDEGRVFVRLEADLQDVNRSSRVKRVAGDAAGLGAGALGVASAVAAVHAVPLLVGGAAGAAVAGMTESTFRKRRRRLRRQIEQALAGALDSVEHGRPPGARKVPWQR